MFRAAAGTEEEEEHVLMTFMPVNCDQICVKMPIKVRLSILGLKRSR